MNNTLLPTTLTLKELLSLPEEFQPKFLIDKIIPQQGITYMFGQPGCGKSWLMFEIARAVSCGDKFLNMLPTIQTNTLIVDEESSVLELKRRAVLLEMEESLPIYFKSLGGFKFDEPETVTKLIKFCKRQTIGLVIFDPFVAMHTSEENSATDMQKVMDAMQGLVIAGITVLFIHHSRKGGFGQTAQNSRGSSAINGRADSTLVVEKTKQGEQEYIDVKHVKSRRGKPLDSFRVSILQPVDDSTITLACIDSNCEGMQKKDQSKSVILDLLRESPLHRKELVELVSNTAKIGERNVVQAIMELERANEISSRQDGKQKIYELTLVEVPLEIE